MKEKVTIEVGVIGKDGMVGIPILLGDDISFEEAIVQMAGDGMRMSSSALLEEVDRGHSPLLTQLLMFTRRLMKQVTQTAACNRLHTIEERLSRWMLMCHDRMETDELPLTQEFISNMLGTRREGVSTAAAALQRRGFISYSRGRISVLDREGLEAFSCECYRAIQEPTRRKPARAKDRAA
jgi:CRP-like cAMP-binding protein